MDDQKRIAAKVSGDLMGQPEPVQYFLDDHLGSSSVVLDNNGSLINREEYYPFGETSFGSFAKKRYRFCGKERDEESGLYYYGARYYAPWICRFVSVDALTHETPFFSPFAYADDNPVMNNDPTGNGTEKADKGGSEPKVHAVKKGETLSSIAKQNGTSVKELRSANNLDPANDKKLQIGTKLNIPGDNKPTPSTSEISTAKSAAININSGVKNQEKTATSSFSSRGPLYDWFGYSDPASLRDGAGFFSGSKFVVKVQTKSNTATFDKTLEFQEKGQRIDFAATDVKTSVSTYDFMKGSKPEASASMYFEFQLKGEQIKNANIKDVIELKFGYGFFYLNTQGQMRIGTKISTSKPKMKLEGKIERRINL